MLRSRSLSRFIGLCIIAAAAVTVGEANAATIVVTTFVDGLNDGDGLCSLREAVQAANTSAAVDACPAGDPPFISPNTIVLGAGTYTLSIAGIDENSSATGDIDLTADMTITGAGATVTIIDASALGDRAFDIHAGADSSVISDLAIVNGSYLASADAEGGAISIDTGGGPGDLVSLERLLIDGHTLLGGTNLATGHGRTAIGGAIWISVDAGDTVNITDTTISNNAALAGPASTGVGGHAQGGGVWIIGNGTVNIVGSTIVDNLGAGGVGVTSDGSGFGGGLSGGIGGGPVNLINSTISGNTTTSPGSLVRGGGIYGGTNLFIVHSTIANNSADQGGGIYSTEFADDAGPVLKSTIVADNTSGGLARDIWNRIQSRGYNLIEEPIDGTVDTAGNGNTGIGNILGLDPTLLPLAGNGGPTMTHALDPSSLAVEGGDCFDIIGAPVTIDQRGAPRPIGPACDIGAFELAFSSDPLIDVTAEPAGPNCADGGQRIDTGIDWDGDGIFDMNEVISTSYVCNGAPGAPGTPGTPGTPGFNALVDVTPEPAGGNCTSGGQRIDTGLDDGSGGGIASDGNLQPGEIVTTSYVCDGLDGLNGTNGTNGTNGFNSLLVSTPEAAGLNCTYGGQRLDMGLDDGTPTGTADDGTLDPGEIDQTSYVCDGAPGSNGFSTLITLTAEPVGANCAAGGQRLEVGLDDGSGGGIASNGTLEAGEIDATTYVCDGIAGVNGFTTLITTTPEPAGATCLGGGLRIDTGVDNGDGGEIADDGVLGTGEIDQTSYVCDGLNGSNGTGYNALIEITTLPVGDTNCPDGGQQIDAGLDDGAGGGIPSNGVLEPGEILTTAYACNGTNGTDGTDGTDGIDGTTGPAGMDGTDGVDGADGTGALFVSTELFLGDAMCTWGGQRIDVGVDDGDGGGTAGDGILDDGEIDETVVVCNGANGDPGEPGGCAILPGRAQTPGAWSALLLALVIAARRRRTRAQRD